MTLTFIRLATGLNALALVAMLAGCGGTPSAAEKPDSPVTGQSARSESAATPNPPAARSELDDVRKLARVIDLSKLPMPEGAKDPNPLPTRLQVNVPLTVPDATAFFIGKLKAVGWAQAGDPTSATITEPFAQVGLSKNGYQLMLTAISPKPHEASVTIAMVGNLNLQTLPRAEGAESQYSFPTSSLYFTKADFKETRASVRHVFTAEGWQEYDRAFTQKAVRPDADDLLFRKKGYSITASISRPPAQPGKTAVQYGVATLPFDMPAPADARRVEIDNLRGKLMCEVPRDMTAVADYYRKAMPEIGFPSPPRETTYDKHRAMSFESDGHDIEFIDLLPADGHAVKVKIEVYTAAFREAIKKAEAETEKKHKAKQ